MIIDSTIHYKVHAINQKYFYLINEYGNINLRLNMQIV